MAATDVIPATGSRPPESPPASRPALATRSRYSIAKAQRFLAYARRASLLRQAIVVASFPVPALLTATATALIPLQNPNVGGIPANWGIFVHHGVTNWMCMVGGMVQARAASSIDFATYSTHQIIMIATLAAAHTVVFFLVISYGWRFPVPFYAGIGPWAYVASLVWIHYLFGRAGRFPRAVRQKLLMYIPPLALQVVQLPLYACYSTLFQAANEWQQLLLVLAFPCLKFVLRRAILVVSDHLGDFAREIAVCGVEISASMYQSAIMQSTPSPLVSASVIGVDVALSVVEIKRYLDHKSSVPSSEVLVRAAQLLETGPPRSDHELAQFGTRTRRSWCRHATHRIHAQGSTSIAVVSAPGAHKDLRLVTHALEILQAAESIVLVEFLEASIPLLNACLLLATSQLPSAQYNRVLRPFQSDPSRLGPAVASILLYTALQAATLVAMGVVMKVRYRLSAMALLAFVLEDHAWSLQGKLVMWLPITLSISIVHYGIDFTLKFDFTLSD